MKTFFLSIILCVNFYCIAQNAQCGVFLTSENYLKSKLSYSFSCDSSEGKIKLQHFFSRNYLEIILKGESTRLYKDSIFGYRNCDSIDFRFYHSGDIEYEILENLQLTIYKAEIKEKLSSSSKTFELVSTCFFSKGIDGEILPLNKFNLKRAFPDNIRFHDLLDIEFKEDSYINIYDTKHQIFKVNFLLNLTTN